MARTRGRPVFHLHLHLMAGRRVHPPQATWNDVSPGVARSRLARKISHLILYRKRARRGVRRTPGCTPVARTRSKYREARFGGQAARASSANRTKRLQAMAREFERIGGVRIETLEGALQRSARIQHGAPVPGTTHAMSSAAMRSSVARCAARRSERPVTGSTARTVSIRHRRTRAHVLAREGRTQRTLSCPGA